MRVGAVWVSVPSQAPDSLGSAERHGCHAAQEDDLQGAEQACVLPRALGEVVEAGRDVVALAMQLEGRDCAHRGAQADESTDQGSFPDGPEGEGHERKADGNEPVHADAQGDEDAAIHVHKVKTLQGGAKHWPQVPLVLEVVGNDFKRKSKQQQSVQEYKGYHVDRRFWQLFNLKKQEPQSHYVEQQSQDKSGGVHDELEQFHGGTDIALAMGVIHISGCAGREENHHKEGCKSHMRHRTKASEVSMCPHSLKCFFPLLGGCVLNCSSW